MQVIPQLKVGGVERGTIEFAIYLQQMGHKPIVVSAGGSLVEQLQAHNITHIELDVGKKSVSSYRTISKLKKLMRQWQVDVVHARSRMPAWLCYWAIKRMRSDKPKFVTTLHGLHSVSRYSSIMARGDAVIAVSASAQEYLLTHFKRFLTSQPKLIYRGIDEQFVHGYKPDQDWYQAHQKKFPGHQAVKTVLMPGRLSAVKGVEHLIPWLSATEHDCQLLLTANPDESKYSRKIAGVFARQQVSQKVVWLGIERNMPDLYAAVDLVVSVNNKAESFGRTVLEALSIGTPVVAFSQGGVAEVMAALYPQGQVKAGDDAALAERIDRFLSQAPVVQPHQMFSNQTMFEETLNVYQQLIHQAEAHE